MCYQNSECIALVTWATVCSPIGMSSFLKATRDTTELESASMMILKLRTLFFYYRKFNTLPSITNFIHCQHYYIKRLQNCSLFNILP